MIAAIDLAIVIPCSKRKVACPLPLATGEDLATAREAAEQRLVDYRRPARDLYLGRQHRAMVAAVDELRTARPELDIALYIVSAGYGLLAEPDLVVPYEAALGSNAEAWRATGARLGLLTAVSSAISHAGITLVCLSAAYLAAAGAPFNCGGQPIYLAANSATLGPDAAIIPAGRAEARRLGVPEREVRGAMLGLLCREISDRGMAALREIRSGRRGVEEVGHEVFPPGLG